jgi:hypothetical protein
VKVCETAAVHFERRNQRFEYVFHPPAGEREGFGVRAEARIADSLLLARNASVVPWRIPLRLSRHQILAARQFQYDAPPGGSRGGLTMDGTFPERPRTPLSS